MTIQREHNNKRPIWPTAGLIFALTLSITGCVLFYLNRNTVVPASWGAAGGARNSAVSWFNALQLGLVVPLLAGSFGYLILRRQIVPLIGRLFMSLSMIGGVMMFVAEYAIFGTYTRDVPMPGTQLAAWVGNFAWILFFTLALPLLAAFPTGRYLSTRWRSTLLVLQTLYTGPLLIGAVIETPLSSAYQIANPFFSSYPGWLYDVLFTVGVTCMLLSVMAVFTAVLQRFRRSGGRERQQMKWLLSGVALMALAVTAGFALRFGLNLTLGDMLVNSSFLWPLLGIGVALVRHRLYDIDFIIRRTLQYSVVSALLALVYFGSVVLLQGVFDTVVGESPLLIVASTLLIAALFNPIRRRVQDAVDRRFYRKKYDAQQVLAQFAQMCRDETNIAALQAELLQVIGKTLQPNRVTLWMKPTDEKSGK